MPDAKKTTYFVAYADGSPVLAWDTREPFRFTDRKEARRKKDRLQRQQPQLGTLHVRKEKT